MEHRILPGGGRLEAERIEDWGDGIDFGPDVIVRARRVSFGDDVRIGTMNDDNAFRFPGGTRIDAEHLVLGDRVRIGRHVRIRGGHISIRRDCRIGEDSTVVVTHRFSLGEHGRINEQCEITGVDVTIGRELWMLPTAKIGGGSAFDVHSRLQAGDWLHLGLRTMVNTARPVTIGDEVGLGTGTSIYTHGAYPSALEGKPVAFGAVTIGDRTWLPGAVVNPGVTIGADCVVGVGSVVTRDVPEGALVAGIPAKVIQEQRYPRPLDGEARVAFLRDFLRTFVEICGDREPGTYSDITGGGIGRIGTTWISYGADPEEVPSANTPTIILTDREGEPRSGDPTVVNLTTKTVCGPASPVTERLLNQLRRNGIRFRFEAHDGRYAEWR